MNNGTPGKGIEMLKTQIILLALVAFWFLCSERPETGEQTFDGRAAIGEGNTIAETNNSAAEHDAPKTEDNTPTGQWVRYGATMAIIIAASQALKHFAF